MHFIRRSFAFPEPLSQALLRSAGVSRNSDISRFSDALKKLWPTLAQKRGVSQADEKHYGWNSKAVETYSIYYLTANCMKIALVLEELRSFGIHLNDLKWFDFGTGPGTCFWGLAWWATHRNAAFDFCGFDQSKNFIQKAQENAGVLRGFLPDLRGKFRFEVKKESKFVDSIAQELPQVVSFMNSIGECFADFGKRKKELQALVEVLRSASRRDQKPRWLILIEPGSLAASRELLELRETLRRESDLKILLPCLDERPCGALADAKDWCHEEVQCEFPPWFDDLGGQAGLRKEALLFSYLVCRIGGETIDTWPKEGLRMVSQRFQEKGLTSCYLCTPHGKVKTRVLNSRVTESNRAFLDISRGAVLRGAAWDEKGSIEEVQFLSGLAADFEMDSIVFPQLR